MRLRGPWIVRSASLDTSVSSAGGFVAGYNTVLFPTSPYTFFPALLHSRTGTALWLTIPNGSLGDIDADSPFVEFKNLMSSGAAWAAEWRHINP